MIWIIVLLPFVSGLVSFAVPWSSIRRAMLVSVSMAHTVGVFSLWSRGYDLPVVGWIGVDGLSLFFLLITSLLFFFGSFSTVIYLKEHRFIGSSGAFSRESAFVGSMLIFLATTTLAIVSHHTGVFWMAIEATTLATAPLIAYQRSPGALEAAWKYLLICSVGIAMALVGNTALAVSSLFSGDGHSISMTFQGLAEHGSELQPLWLKIAFAFILVGYGTKMGLAPMHPWLPDAYSEAPSPVSALLSGALSNCALLGIIRTGSILNRAGLEEYWGTLMVAFGVLSVITAGCMILGQSGFKRLLAYSSVEHMGILAIAIGIGAGSGGLFHSLNNSLTKGSLFFVAGSVLSLYHTKAIASISGLIRLAPVTGAIWIAGSMSICGLPPFGTFFSEMMILSSLGSQGMWGVMGLLLLGLAMVFIGMWRAVISMVFGDVPPGLDVPSGRKVVWADIPPMVLCGAVLVLGLWTPAPLWRLIESAATVIGGGM
ncbi:MAG: proton-conducting transporter membrane subunit [Dethiosulfovibrio sp.]|nr:proton-conducting transporter membrane subunit [Dethiosulfovibrio sp.]